MAEYFLSFLLLCKTCKTAFEKVVKVNMPNPPRVTQMADSSGKIEKEMRLVFEKGIEKLDFKCNCDNPYQVIFLGMRIISRE